MSTGRSLHFESANASLGLMEIAQQLYSVQMMLDPDSRSKFASTPVS
ncbi:hypothetical protein WJX82_011126 [Trebouxia sp. C0006]